MSGYLIWLIIVVVIAVAVPVVIKLIADWDYRRQISGKKKERSFVGETILQEADELVQSADALKEKMEHDAAIGEMRMKSQQNAMSMGMLQK
jgi:hypothetical protein